jgi:uncharacterized protein YjeT (DUF2065 family)
MNDLHKRWLMFLGLCIPSRYLIAYVLSKLSEAHLRIAGLVLLLPVLGFSYIYVTKFGGILFDHSTPVSI